MKRAFLFLLSSVTMAAGAQSKGNMEVFDLGHFKLHVYNTNDVMADASYIVEGEEKLVTLEQPLFKENVKEFDAYVAHLGKPVEKIITNYHVGGTADREIVMVEGMPAFTRGAVYGGMMQNFAKIFGDAIVPIPTGEAKEVALGSTHNWAGVEFTFYPGVTTDFPAASILIGGKVYYTHWTPAKAHVSHLQVSSPAAVDAEIAEAEKELRSGCEIFIGGHGGVTQSEAVQFKVGYLKKIKQLLSHCKTPEAFIEEIQKVYPDLPGETELPDLTKALYAGR